LTVGGGLDYNTPWLGGKLGLRIFQVDYQYYHINFGPQSPVPEGGRANVNAVRVSSGLLLHFGSIVPPPPVTYSCSVSPTAVYQGDPVTVTGTALNLNPKKTATYTWSGQGLTIKGDSTTGTIDTASLAPGTYPVTGHVTEGNKVGQFADCTASVVVKPFDPPTVSCSANPSTIKPGDSSTINSTGSQPQNRPLTYTYSASAGSVSGSGNTATLTTAGAPAGPIAVTCDVADDKGGKAESTTTVNVEQPAPPPVPHVKTLCSINFERDAKRPARVDNEAKGCLDDVALALQQSSDATAIVVGSAAATEKKADELAAQRAVNTKAYLVTEKGIDAGRVSVKTGDAGSKEVKNYLVPAGANFDTDIPGTKPVDEGKFKAQSRTAPVKHKKHKKAEAAAK
jgi:outer membrane protein OmpA-like peptidoglycan-associated protein